MALIELGPSEAVVREARESVLAILGSGQEQKTIRMALRAFVKGVSVDNAVISGCTFYGDEKKP